MSIDTDFQNKLFTLSALPTQQDTISEDKTQPYVWFQRHDAMLDTFLNGTASITETTYTVEVSGLDIDSVQATADTLKTSLNAYQGTMGSTVVLGCFVEDCADDYAFRNTDQDAGNHVAAFSARFLHV